MKIKRYHPNQMHNKILDSKLCQFKDEKNPLKLFLSMNHYTGTCTCKCISTTLL